MLLRERHWNRKVISTAFSSRFSRLETTHHLPDASRPTWRLWITLGRLHQDGFSPRTVCAGSLLCLTPQSHAIMCVSWITICKLLSLTHTPTHRDIHEYKCMHGPQSKKAIKPHSVIGLYCVYSHKRVYTHTDTQRADHRVKRKHVYVTRSLLLHRVYDAWFHPLFLNVIKL